MTQAYSILFEYLGGATDRVTIHARNSQEALRLFYQSRDRRYYYILFVEIVG
jgi:hypothetical protein